MNTISVHWADKHLEIWTKDIKALNTSFPKVLPRIVNQVGNRAKTQVIRHLTKQTGLKRETIVKAIGRPSPAHIAKLSYEMKTTGGNVRLKYLNPKENDAGVIAKPFNKPTLYPGAFMMGGAFPDRKVVQKFDGHVMVRNRSKGRHYTFARSGVIIPDEMTSGATLSAFDRIAGSLLQQRVNAAITKLIK